MLDDPRIIANTKRWVEGIIANQKPDGFFGPERLRPRPDSDADIWPHLVAADVVHSYYEHSGDKRAFEFLRRFLRWQSAQSAKYFAGGFGALRAADNLYTVHWLYNRTGEPWLLDLARKIHDNAARYTPDLPTLHNVNLAQGIREPGQFWMQSGDPKHLATVEATYGSIISRFGQFAGGGFAGDEAIRPEHTDPRQGFETCGIVEMMRTHEIMARISGEATWADRADVMGVFPPKIHIRVLEDTSVKWTK